MAPYILAGFAIAILVLNYFDVWTTNANFKLGGGEANPVMAWCQRKFGKAWWVPKTLLIFAGYSIFWLIETKGPPLGGFLILFPAAITVTAYALTVKDNYAVMRRLKEELGI